MSTGTLSTFSKTVFACLHENSRLPFTNVHNFGGSRKSRFHTAAFEIVLMCVLGQYAGQLIRFQTNMVTIRRFLLMCQVEGVVG